MIFGNVPEELRLLPNWLVWRLEYPNGPDKKPTKRPYRKNGQWASVTEPEHWMTFEEAFNILQFGNYNGLGFVFTNTKYSGIDLDDPSSLLDGSPNPNYQADFSRQVRIAQEFDSYSELSPSGKGLHIIVEGKVPEGKRSNFIELYPSGRFFTMTGQVHNNKPIANFEVLLNQLWAQMGGVASVAPIVSTAPQINSDNEILALALKHNAVAFEPLQLGDFSSYPSQSEADQAYMNIIAYYTDNKEQVIRIYSNSKLAQTDSKRRHKGYLQRTVNKAFDQKLPPVNFVELRQAIKTKTAVSSTQSKRASKVILPPGLLGEIAQFIYNAAPKPVMEIALAGAIGLMAGICGKAYNVSDMGLNQYILMIAGTGKGKEAMASGISKLINAVTMQVPVAPEFIGPSAIASKQGLHKYLVKNSSCFVSIIGEFGLTLKAMSGERATSHQTELQAALLDIYHKSGFNDSYGGSAYSDQDKNSVAISAPAFSILGESTPETFYSVLDEQMINSGLLPRFTIIEYTGPRVRSNPNKVINPPITLTERLASLIVQAKTVVNNRRVINVQLTPEALALSKSIDQYSDDKINNTDKQFVHHLWNRAHIKALKLAALVAVGNNLADPIITVDCLNWAMALVDNDVKSLSTKFETGKIGVSNSELKQEEELIRIIKEYVVQPYSDVEKYLQYKSRTMHSDKIIPYGYLNKRLAAVAAFRTDRLGATISIKRAIQNLVDADRLKELNKMFMNEKYGTGQRSFVVADTSLLD